jgi:hypothetical protein
MPSATARWTARCGALRAADGGVSPKRCAGRRTAAVAKARRWLSRSGVARSRPVRRCTSGACEYAFGPTRGGMGRGDKTGTREHSFAARTAASPKRTARADGASVVRPHRRGNSWHHRPCHRHRMAASAPRRHGVSRRYGERTGVCGGDSNKYVAAKPSSSVLIVGASPEHRGSSSRLQSWSAVFRTRWQTKKRKQRSRATPLRF